VQKIRRGGTGPVGNSGTAPRRTYTAVRAIRDPKNGKHLPWPPRAKPIWDPRDPIIIAYQGTLPVPPVKARRVRPAPLPRKPHITRFGKRVRGHFDFNTSKYRAEIQTRVRDSERA
jgi:hypothetical protein